MNLSKIESAAKILAEIKAIDAEIISIDKFANIIASENKIGKLELHVEVPAESKKENVIDEDGGILSRYRSGMDLDSFANSMRVEIMKNAYHPFASCFGVVEKMPSPKTSLTAELPDTVMLQVLGVLLSDKQRKRDLLVSKIVKMGFEL